MSDTHREHVSEGYYVTIQHCERCNIYLGVNYPSTMCDKCRRFATLQARKEG